MMNRVLSLTLALALCGSVSAQTGEVSVAKYRADKKAAVSLTFDDGLAEHYTIVAPELEKRGFRGTFGVIGSKLNKDGRHVKDTTRMTWQQVKELAQRGHEISNHGWAHRNHGKFPLDAIRRDIQHNDTAILQHTGIMPRTFFYPNNTKVPAAMAIAEQGRVGTRTFQRSVGSKWTEAQLEKWITHVADTAGWAVTMTHGITYGYDAFRDKKRLTDFLDYLASRKDELWIAPLQDVMAYTKEQRAIKLDVKRGKSAITVIPEMPLDKSLFSYPLTMTVTTGKAGAITARQDGRKLDVQTGEGKALFDFNPSGGSIVIDFK